MPREILQRRQRELLEWERGLANELQACLDSFDRARTYAEALRKVVASLDELYLLVVVGEFNAGKSTFINSLLGAKTNVVKEGIRPTTDKVTILRFGEDKEQNIDQDTVEHLYPSNFLRNISIVDTPGSNSVLQGHEHLTQEFIPQSDLILFVMWAAKAFTDSERVFLELIRFWNIDMVIIVNKIDEMTPEDLSTVIEDIRVNCKSLLNFDPPVIPISALEAKKSYTATDSEEIIEHWEKSRFQPLILYLTEKLQEMERVRTKLRRPLGIMQSLQAKTRQVLDEHGLLLNEDTTTINTIREKVMSFNREMQIDFPNRLAKIENVVLGMRRRGNIFFDETIRPGRVFDLIHPERVRDEFEKDVIGRSGVQIDEAVQNLIDWFLEQEQSLWKNVMEYVERRRQMSIRRYHKVIETEDQKFDIGRRKQLQTLSKTAKDIVNNYNHQEEAQKLSQRLWKAVVGVFSAGVGGIGGIGLGPAIIALLGAPVAGVGSLLAGGVLVIFTLSLIPQQRRIAKHDFDEQMEQLEIGLRNALTQELKNELNEIMTQMNSFIKPYENFVNEEKDKLFAINKQLTDLSDRMASLMIAIENLR